MKILVVMNVEEEHKALLSAAAPEADIVAACLPDTPETRNLFNEEAFSHMKKGAYFLNVGRGNSVDSDALYEALCSGKLAGASVDVTDPEPLPADHKLWDAPNILITPHISGGYHLKQTHDTIIRIACDKRGQKGFLCNGTKI